MAQGTPDEVAANARVADRPLPRAARCASPCRKRRPRAWPTARRAALRIVGARGNNLQGVDVAIPVGLFTCVTGVSGSGKIDAGQRHAVRRGRASTLYNSHAEPAPHDAIEGIEALRQGDQRRPVRRSAARRAATRPPTPACSRRSASCSPRCRRRASAATGRAASRSTSPAAAARPARATACSRSRCTSCPTSTCPATSATASATTARRWRSSTRARTSPRCST